MGPREEVGVRNVMNVSAEEWRAGLETLGLSQVGAARVFRCSRRTAQTYAAEGPSGPAGFAMQLLLSLPPKVRAVWLAPASGPEEE
jgi:hypothetical protein